LAGPCPQRSTASLIRVAGDVVKRRSTSIAGIKTDYPPFGDIDEKGNNAGLTSRSRKYIAKKLGVGIELRAVACRRPYRPDGLGLSLPSLIVLALRL
jgi:hypothetical protein